MPTIFRDENPELAQLRLDLARLYRAATAILRTIDYQAERGAPLPIPRGDVARFRHAVDAIKEADQS